MCSHGLRQLVDDKSVASRQQTSRKLNVTGSLQMTSCKPDFKKLCRKVRLQTEVPFAFAWLYCNHAYTFEVNQY